MSRNTNWIYNDYEFENRVNNLAWTISGMYDEDLGSSEKDYSSKDVSLYFAIIAGARRKYLDWNIIKRPVCRPHRYTSRLKSIMWITSRTEILE